jgi:hypothetical protein
MRNSSEDISRHILPVSATMVGVCMTVITLMQIVPKNRISQYADDLLAIDSLFFLASTLLSYWAIRPQPSSMKIESMADRLFLLGMVCMVIISFLVAFELFID